jgi:hypothetical protein
LQIYAAAAHLSPLLPCADCESVSTPVASSFLYYFSYRMLPPSTIFFTTEIECCALLEVCPTASSFA